MYDDNGNMIERKDHITPITYTQEFDVENRMITVTNNLTTTETVFSYDDTGQRTATSVENAGDSRIITYFPFPAYEKELHQVWECVPDFTGCTWTWSTEETIIRKMYNAGGQAIATRVSGDPVSTNNGLFYFHSDHLGSATFLTYGNGHANEGLKVANSTKFFTPFGEYRIEPPSPVDGITDRGYTGHKHNDEIGLIYMNARYYVPAIGRFASADTIVPNPTNPQAFNRFSYVLNNPLNLVDPSGHGDCPLDAPCDPPPSNDSSSSSGSNSSSQTPPAGAGGHQQLEPDDWGPPIAGNISKAGGFYPNSHPGQDIYGNVAADLLAVGNGTVVYVADSEEDGYGFQIVIEYKWEDLPPEVRERLRNAYPDLDFGPGKSIYVQYQHMAAQAADPNGNKLTVGQTVTAGQIIGIQGDTGETGDPPEEHLHLEVRVGESGYFNAGGTAGKPWNSTNWHDLTVVDPNLIWNFD